MNFERPPSPLKGPDHFQIPSALPTALDICSFTWRDKRTTECYKTTAWCIVRKESLQHHLTKHYFYILSETVRHVVDTIMKIDGFVMKIKQMGLETPSSQSKKISNNDHLKFSHDNLTQKVDETQEHRFYLIRTNAESKWWLSVLQCQQGKNVLQCKNHCKMIMFVMIDVINSPPYHQIFKILVKTTYSMQVVNSKTSSIHWCITWSAEVTFNNWAM